MNPDARLILDSLTTSKVDRLFGTWRFEIIPEPEIHPCPSCGKVETLDSRPCGECRGKAYPLIPETR